MSGNARRYFLEALQGGLTEADQGLMTYALTGLAELALATGRSADALVLAAFCDAHHATWHEHRQRAAQVSATAAPHLAPAAARRATAYGAALKLDEAIAYARHHLAGAQEMA
jgi:hypothetical protein